MTRAASSPHAFFMTAREQFERFLRVTLLVFILAAAGFLSAMTAIRIAIRGRVVSMPNLVGKQSEDAERTLSAYGLQLRVADRQYSTMSVNAIVRQSPAPGEQVKVSQDVQVILSLGAQKLTVPTLAGRSLRAAHIALLEAGLPLGEVSTASFPAWEAGTVVEQDPPAGSTAVVPRVDLLVSGDDPPVYYVMPSLIGMEQAEAQRVLMADGLRVAKVNNVTETGSPKETVIGQVPARGARITGDIGVEISVAQ